MQVAELEAEAPGLSNAASPGVYYGWAMLPMAMAALVASSPGQTFGVSIFNEPIRQSLGLSHSQIALAYTLGTLLGAVPITYIGGLMDRQGLRRTILGAITLFSGACLALSLAGGWLTLLIGFCLLRMLGPGALAFLSGNTLAFWFDRRLGMVEGVRQLGMAAAMATIPALNVWLLNAWGWRGAYAVLGAALWIVLFPTFLLFFRNRPEDVGQQIDGARGSETADQAKNQASADAGLTLSETLRTPAFWVVTTGTVMYAMITTAIFFCLAPIFYERGLTDEHAALTMTLFAICMAVMQLSGGMLADRLKAPVLLALGLCGLSTAMVLLLNASSPPAAYIAGAVLGASQGLFFGSTHPLWARYFGRRHIGKIRGVLMTTMVAFSSLGPLLAGLAGDYLGGFSPALVGFAIMPLIPAALSFLAQPPEMPSASASV